MCFLASCRLGEAVGSHESHVNSPDLRKAENPTHNAARMLIPSWFSGINGRIRRSMSSVNG